MKITVDGTSCQLLKKLLGQHLKGESRLFWKTYDFKLPARYRMDAAAPLLNQLNEQQTMLYLDGNQKDLLLQLLAWKEISGPSMLEPGAAKNLLTKLQPQGAPIGAEIGDFLEVRKSGSLVEIVHFNGGDDGYLVSNTTTDIIACNIYENPATVDTQFTDFSRDDLMWPTRMSAEQIIWGPSPHQLAA